MTHDEARAWLARYVEAWESYDKEAIGALFSEDAEYRYHPADEPIRGRETIVRSWVEPDGDANGRDEAGTYEARYEPWAIDGSRVVAVGWSRYFTDPTRATVRTVYDNCFLIEFDDEGRCRSFTEFFRERPAPGG